MPLTNVYSFSAMPWLIRLPSVERPCQHAINRRGPSDLLVPTCAAVEPLSAVSKCAISLRTRLSKKAFLSEFVVLVAAIQTQRVPGHLVNYFAKFWKILKDPHLCN